MKFGRGVLAVLASLGTCGCLGGVSTFEIIDHREAGPAIRLRESFDEAYFDLHELGNVDLVLRRVARGPSKADDVTQIIHIRSMWRSSPGNTVAQASQINGTVSYHILSGQVGAVFEGAGAVFFRQKDDGTTLTGSLELACLRPVRRLAASYELFQRAELNGKFRAKRNPRMVRHLIHEMNRLFGPLPPA